MAAHPGYQAQARPGERIGRLTTTHRNMGISFPFSGLQNEEKKQTSTQFYNGLYVKRILITGAKGQLGNEMRRQAEQHTGFDWDFTDIDELDLCNEEAVLEYCERTHPAYIVNCAAYTAVDKAEDDIDTCYRVNRDAVTYLAKAATAINARILHVSTDYVFDGSQRTPYKETDPVCPATVYGKSKLAGEETLVEHCTDAVIVRTAWLYSSFGNNFVKTMLRLGRERDTLGVVNDQIGSPTYAGDLAGALMDIILQAEKGQFKPGLYHYSDEGVCSWYDFTLKIHELAGITSCKVSPISSAEYTYRTPRPAYSVLDKTKLIADYGLTIPSWEDSLAVCIAELHD